MADEQIKCNICGIAVSTGEAKQHAASSSHESRRKELEHELEEVRKERYKNDSSVILQWENSTLR